MIHIFIKKFQSPWHYCSLISPHRFFADFRFTGSENRYTGFSDMLIPNTYNIRLAI